MVAESPPTPQPPRAARHRRRAPRRRSPTLAWTARRLFGWRPGAAGIFATVLGALIFSAFHYIGPYGDPLQLQSFVFRALSGLAFSALYLLRGFGITAWTHALYDAFLLLT